MISKVRRRVRCEYIHCHEPGFVGLGSKDIDYFLCKKHFAQLVKEALPIAVDENVFGVEIDSEKVLAEARQRREDKKNGIITEEPKKEPKEVSVPTTVEDIMIASKEKLEEEAGKEYYTCKHCGMQFDRDEYTFNMYAQHCRRCSAKQKREEKAAKEKENK